MNKPCCAGATTTMVRVGTAMVGIVGLENAFRQVSALQGASEEELTRELLNFVRVAGNYIPLACEAEYGKALLREYTLFLATRVHSVG